MLIYSTDFIRGYVQAGTKNAILLLAALHTDTHKSTSSSSYSAHNHTQDDQSSMYEQHAQHQFAAAKCIGLTGIQKACM